ncbi:MAG: DUF5107 domain-containing protein, partial [bacterium]|nr:DUF5107 domain-containing protein [bacterium]
EKDFKKAVQLGKNQWRARHRLTNFYIETGMYDRALDSAKRMYGKNYILAMDYARALLLTGSYKKCLAVLAKTTILPYEGAREGRNLYREANLLYAVQQIKKGKHKHALKYIADARRWPENLGVGKPYDTDEGLEDYLESLCRNKEKKTVPPPTVKGKDSGLLKKILEILM